MRKGGYCEFCYIKCVSTVAKLLDWMRIAIDLFTHDKNVNL